MKALVFDGPHEIGVQHRPDPVPGPGEVVVRTVATGICGSDLHGYTGENGRRHPGQVMGHETVARVAGVGSDVAGLAVGSLVTVNPVLSCGRCPACLAKQEQLCPDRRVIGVDPAISAAFAELMLVPARAVVPLPADLRPEIGALVEPLSVGYHAARRGGVADGTPVLVIGGGPIGQAAALAARRLGARVVVSELSASRSALLGRLGFVALDPRGADTADRILAELGERPRVVIDAVAVPATVDLALTVSTIGATVVLVGMNARQLDLSAYKISTEERSVVGSFCYGSEEFADTAAWAGAHATELLPLVEGVVTMDDAAAAFADLAAGRNPASKVLVSWSGEVTPR